MKEIVKFLMTGLMLGFWNCGINGASMNSQEPAIKIWTEQWDNGNTKVEYEYFLDAADTLIKHGYYREYSAPMSTMK